MRLPEESVAHPKERLDPRSMNKDQRPGKAASVNPTEQRRKNPRTPIHRLAYVNLEPYDNGGVITDISRDGLRFHMVNPVEQGGLVRLSILLGGANQIHVIGELIWMDATRKIGGVRFTVLPDGAADQILNWAQASNSAETSKSSVSRPNGATHSPSIPNQAAPQPEAAASTDNVSATPTANPAGAPHTMPTRTDPELSARSAWEPPSVRPSAGTTGQTRSPDLPNAGTPARQPWVPPGAYQQPDAMPWITHFDPDPPARGSSFVRGVVGGVLLCALLGFAAWFGLRQRLWQNSPISISNPLGSNTAASSPLAAHQALPPTDRSADVNAATDVKAPNSPQPEQAQSASSREASPAAPPNLQANPNVRPRPDTGLADASASEPKAAMAPRGSESQTPSPQAPIADRAPATALSAEKGSPAPAPQQIAKTPASSPPPAADAGESQLMLARQYLDGRGYPRNPTVASQLLWSAVEKGNSAAEMDLADLYLRGDGVARNCDQARVLLSVASGKGNTEAMQKLSELNRTGCR